MADQFAPFVAFSFWLVALRFTAAAFVRSEVRKGRSIHHACNRNGSLNSPASFSAGNLRLSGGTLLVSRGAKLMEPFEPCTLTPG